MTKGNRVQTMATTDLWSHAHDERAALLELLEDLTIEEWDSATLCSGWRVRDVVAHLVLTTEVNLPRALVKIARARFSMNRYIDTDARRRGAMSPTHLLADFRASLPRTAHPPGQSALAMLEDIVIHQIDIRVPLGRPRPVPVNRMRLVADYLDGNSFYVGKKLARGLRLEATDTDWASGDGPIVTGPIEALALTLSGRFVALDDLAGSGVPVLTDRIRAAKP